MDLEYYGFESSGEEDQEVEERHQDPTCTVKVYGEISGALTGDR